MAHDPRRQAIVVTVDARGSGGLVSPIEAVGASIAAELAREDVPPPLLPFAQTVGDELQGVVADAGTAVSVLVALARLPVWVGVGIGPVEELRAEPRLSGGTAFDRARRALDEASGRRGSGRRSADANRITGRWPVAVRGGDDGGVEVEYACALLWYVVERRSERQREVVALAREGANHAAIAAALDVQPSTVSRALAAAGWPEEGAARHLLEHLLERRLERPSGVAA
jgi:hypothetical protein